MSLSEIGPVNSRANHAHSESPNQPCHGQKSGEEIREQITHPLRVQINHVTIRNRASKFESKSRTSWESKSTMSWSEMGEEIREQITHKLRVQINHVIVRNRVSTFESKPRTIWESKSTMSPLEIGPVNLRANHARPESPNQPCHSQKSGQYIWEQTTHILRVQINHVTIRNWFSTFESKPRTPWESKSTMSPSEIGPVDLGANHAQSESPNQHVIVRNRVSRFESKSRTSWESKSTMSRSEIVWLDSTIQSRFAPLVPEKNNDGSSVKAYFSRIKSKETNKLFDMDIADQPQLNVLIRVLVYSFTSGCICCLKPGAAIVGTWRFRCWSERT